MTVIQLQCQCNNYPWGKVGKESLAARYASVAPGTDFKIDDDKPYAEMWMGTYPSTPSKILSTGKLLQEHIDNNVNGLIGKEVYRKFGSDLPFLPKVLSIAKALPLQIHPDKDLAARLHKEQPDKFEDSNHKPEISVALGPFETFVGWLPLSDIKQLWTSIPVLSNYVNKDQDFSKEKLRELVRNILSASDNEIANLYKGLRTTSESAFTNQPYIPQLLPRLAEQYDKSDPGILIALLTMNFLVLQKGESIYIPADGIHAYLSGDIIECMARSDNVLNTGFCPRADRDSVEVFSDALTFSPIGQNEAKLRSKVSPKSVNGHTDVYSPPLSEFEMLRTNIKDGNSEIIKALKGPGVMVVTSGSGKLEAGGESFDLVEGYVFFIGYNTELKFLTEKGLEAYLAYCEA